MCNTCGLLVAALPNHVDRISNSLFIAKLSWLFPKALHSLPFVFHKAMGALSYLLSLRFYPLSTMPSITTILNIRKRRTII